MPLSLIDVVGEPDARENLLSYFRGYTGRFFEAIGSGLGEVLISDRIDADDLLAVQMLSVRVPSELAAGLLLGDLGREMGNLLRPITTGVELGTQEALDLLDPAETAWRRLKQQDGVDWVIAGKIMARKRPHLVPVYDRVVRCQLGRPEQFWIPLHERLAADDARLRQELAALRVRAEVPARVSLLRVLDVVLWMRHHRDHVEALTCPGYGTITLA